MVRNRVSHERSDSAQKPFYVPENELFAAEDDLFLGKGQNTNKHIYKAKVRRCR